MQTFAPGDRDFAINTDQSLPIFADTALQYTYCFSGQPLRKNTVYHVERVRLISDGLQGLFITGLLALYGDSEIAWHNRRFRKVELLAGHTAIKPHRKEPVGETTKIRKLVTT
jgi:hypothetical protein